MRLESQQCEGRGGGGVGNILHQLGEFVRVVLHDWAIGLVDGSTVVRGRDGGNLVVCGTHTDETRSVNQTPMAKVGKISGLRVC